MVVRENFMIVEYPQIHLQQKDTTGLRGFFADIDRGAEVIHNHSADGSSIYRYPRVQYKLKDGHAMVIAFGDSIGAFYPMIMEHTDIRILDRTYVRPEMHIQIRQEKIGDREDELTYRFISPWLGLNQINYKKYMESEDEEEKRLFLEKIMTGNILSMCKGFGVKIERRLRLHADLHPVHVTYKGEKMIGFKGQFTVNASLPSLCGLGKGVAIGYGTFTKKKGTGEKIETS